MSRPLPHTRTAGSRAVSLGVAATTAALVVGGFVALPGVAQATTADAQTIIVTPASGLLDTSLTRTEGHNDFLEDGLHVYTDDTSGQAKAAGYIAQVEPLTAFAAAPDPVLDWTLDPGFSATPGKQIVVDFDGTDGKDGILVGEPVYGANWWLAEGEEFVQLGAPHNGGGHGSNWYGTLDEWSAAFAGATTVSVGYSLGSGVHGGGVISSMTYSDTTYEFALGVGPCLAAIDDVAKTYTLTADCSTFQTINVPDGWTIDGDGHTLTAVEDGAHPNFPGAIIVSATGPDAGPPASMHVTDLDIDTSFSGSTSGGNLAGIRFNKAGGSVTDVDIIGVTHGNGVQEGNALFIRNRHTSGSSSVPEVSVTVDDVTVDRYQKTGVIFDGNVDFSMTNSTVGRSSDQDGNPINIIAANAVQISRGAHGTVNGSTIALNDYNPSSPPGDGSSATGILLYNAAGVSISESFVAGTNGDVGMDIYNDGTGSFTTVVDASCNLFERNDDGVYDPYGLGISESDGPVPVTLNLSDTTFTGWNDDVMRYDEDGEEAPGAPNQQLGACVASAPAVSASVDDDVADVTWTPSTAPAYAPISGYEVTLTGDDSSSETLAVDADVTSAQFEDLLDGVTYTVSVVALNASGESAAGTAVLYGTSLTLAPDSPTVTYKKSTMVRGTLSSADSGADLDGRTITIEARPNGASGWSVAGTTTTEADGSYELSVTPKKHTAYRAQYAGGPDMPSTSGPATVYVKIKVTMKTADKTVAEGTTVKFDGKALPKKLKGKPVQLERKIGSDWVLVDADTLRNGGRYKFFWDAEAGTSDWRVVVPGTSDFLKGTSKPITMIVS